MPKRYNAIFTIIIFFLCSLAVNYQAQAATLANYYVDNKTGSNCSNSGAGSLAQPYCTVHRGLSQLQEGDTLLIRSGTYDEMAGHGCFAGNDCGTLDIENMHGSAGKPITIKGFPGDSMPIIKGDADRYAAYIGGSSYITIDGLRITNGYRGLMIPGGDNIIIRNSEMDHSAGQTGGNNQCGICLLFPSGPDASNITLDHNKIHDNFENGSGSNMSGIHVYGTVNLTISNNEVYNQLIGIYIKGTPGGTNHNTKIFGNIIHDVIDSGIEVHGQGDAFDTDVYQNIIYDANPNDSYKTPIGLSISIGSDDGQAYNTRFFNNVVDCAGRPESAGFYSRFSNDGTKVFNNIFVDCGQGADTRAQDISVLFVSDSSGGTTNFSENNNILWNSPNNTKYFYWGLTNQTYDLQGWKNLTGNGTNDLLIDPHFVNRVSHDYHLQPAISATPNPACSAGQNGTYAGAFSCDSDTSPPGAPGGLQVQ